MDSRACGQCAPILNDGCDQCHAIASPTKFSIESRMCITCSAAATLTMLADATSAEGVRKADIETPVELNVHKLATHGDLIF